MKNLKTLHSHSPDYHKYASRRQYQTKSLTFLLESSKNEEPFKDRHLNM